MILSFCKFRILKREPLLFHLQRGARMKGKVFYRVVSFFPLGFLSLLLGILPFNARSLKAAELFRTTPTVGAVGDGRLTAQISWEGTIICLRYPNATFYEHIRFAPGFWDPDPNRNAWLKPHFGGQENGGIFAGVAVTEAGLRRVYWLRELKRSFAYASPRSNRLLGIYESNSGLKIEEETFVVPNLPVLFRSYRILSLPSPLSSPTLIVISNLALSLKRNPYNPLHQTEEDDKPRFASFYLGDRAGVLSVLPRRNLTTLREEVIAFLETAPTPEDVVGFVLGKVDSWGEGIYFFEGGTPPPLGYQVGRDALLSSFGPEDAYRDAQDGILSGSPLAVSWETIGLEIPFLGERAMWFGAFATTAAELWSTVEQVRSRPLPEWERESDQFFSDWTEGFILPEGDKARDFAYRTAISLRTGYDPESGAIVASTSCSPPYNLDWPRDGAFFQLFLLMNGKLKEAEKHALFYPRIQYKNGWGLYGPPGAFAMNGYADGTPGGPVDFEIDEIGFVLWIYEMTAAALASQNPKEALRFLSEIRTSAYLASELLTRCRDEVTALQCKANEDDNPRFTQTIHGAITVWMGLTSSARIFAALGEEVLKERYQARAHELARAIRIYLNPQKPLSLRADNLDLRAYAWTVWPAYFFSAFDGEILAYLRKAFISQLAYVFGPQGRDTIYDTKPGISLLIPPLRTEETVGFMSEIARIYLEEVVTPGTLHLAEVSSRLDLDGDGKEEWVNRVAPPHLWAQTLLYFVLVGLDDPHLLTPPRLNPEAFLGEESPPGCSCNLTRFYGRKGSFLGFLFLSLLSLLFWLNLRRRGKFAGEVLKR